MHELGVVVEVIKTVEDFAGENNITDIRALVLQIGELSSMVPRYVEDCFPAAADGTMLEKAKLEIEILPGNGLCGECRKVFNLKKNKNICPHCGGREWELLCGREFMIKEIIAY